MLESDLPAFLKPGNKVVIFEKQTHLLNRIKTPQAETKVYAKKNEKTRTLQGGNCNARLLMKVAKDVFEKKS